MSVAPLHQDLLFNPVQRLSKLESDLLYLKIIETITEISACIIGLIALYLVNKKFPKQQKSISIITGSIIYFLWQYIQAPYCVKEKPLKIAIDDEKVLVSRLKKENKLKDHAKIIEIRMQRARSGWVNMLLENTKRNAPRVSNDINYHSLNKTLLEHTEQDAYQTHMKALRALSEKNNLKFHPIDDDDAIDTARIWYNHIYYKELQKDHALPYRFINHYRDATVRERNEMRWNPEKPAITYYISEKEYHISLQDLMTP